MRWVGGVEGKSFWTGVMDSEKGRNQGNREKKRKGAQEAREKE